jgi:CDP-diacylglycerol---glycerol-3-phosphate 3-phosphatidyltransferase
MSASREHARELRKGASVLPDWVKDAARGILAPVVRLAITLHLTPNTITVIGLLITVVAAILVGSGSLLLGAAVLTAGSLLDAVDGALARAQGGGTAFGSFLDSTLDRVGEGLMLGAIGLVFMRDDHEVALALTIAAIGGSFLVPYARTKAEGLGIKGDVGIGSRAERVVVISTGLFLAPWGVLPWAIGLLAVVAWVTVVQRILHVRRHLRRAA